MLFQHAFNFCFQHAPPCTAPHLVGEGEEQVQDVTVELEAVEHGGAHHSQRGHQRAGKLHHGGWRGAGWLSGSP